MKMILDPEYEKTIERFNRYFPESIFDFKLLPHEELLYYLSTTLLWEELGNKRIKELEAERDNLSTLHIAACARIDRDAERIADLQEKLEDD